MRGFRRTLRDNGLNEQEWRIIRALMEVEQIEIGELAERVFILKPSATRTIKNLQSRKLVIRNRSKADQRRAFIAISDTGRELFQTVAPKSEAEYARISNLIGDRDVKLLYELLGRLTETLNITDSIENGAG